MTKERQGHQDDAGQGAAESDDPSDSSDEDLEVAESDDPKGSLAVRDARRRHLRRRGAV